jgi:short-subunit dehydrogenase
MASAILRKAWEGKWALVTGASAGIGEALAVELAQAGVHLVLTARRRERLEALASRLASQHSVQNRVLVADLTRPEAPAEIFAGTEGLITPALGNTVNFSAPTRSCR